MQKDAKYIVIKGVVTMIIVALAGFLCLMVLADIPILMMNWKAYLRQKRRNPM